MNEQAEWQRGGQRIIRIAAFASIRRIFDEISVRKKVFICG